MKIEKEKINIFILMCFTGLVICLGTFISYGSLGLDNYLKNEFVLSIPILLLMVLRDGESIFIVSKKYVWCLLIFAALASEIINGRIHIINLCSMLLFVLSAARLREQTYKILIGAIIIAQFIFFYFYRLEGYFNSYALTTAIAGIEIMLMLFISQRSRLWQLLTVFLVYFLVLFVMASRTSLLAFAVGGVILILGSINQMEKNRYFTLCAVVILGLVFLWKYYDLIYELFFNKWINLGYSTVDISSGRFTMWRDVVLNQKSLFGHGDNFAFDKYGHQDLHNIFIQVLGKYGIVCFLTFVIWLLDFVKKLVKLSNSYRLMFLSFFLFYFIAGMTENVLFLDCKVFMIAFCFCVNLAWFYKISDLEKSESLLLQEREKNVR